MAKSHERQFSALIDPRRSPPVPLEAEALLAHHVLLHDPTTLGASAVENPNPRLEDLGWTNDIQDLPAGCVVHREAVREELIDAADEPEELAGFRLALLPDHADLAPCLVQDPVLVCEPTNFGFCSMTSTFRLRSPETDPRAGLSDTMGKSSRGRHAPCPGIDNGVLRYAAANDRDAGV